MPDSNWGEIYRELGARSVINAFKRLSHRYSPTERAAMFHDNAARVYRINV